MSVDNGRILEMGSSRGNLEEAIDRADSEMYFRHLGAAGLSPQEILESFSRMTKAMAAKLGLGNGSLESERRQDLTKVAKTIAKIKA